MGGGGAQVPWGRRHWVGIHFCRHPEVVKLQQQCQCRILFLIYPTTGAILFFLLGEGECQYILETATGELEGKIKMTIQ